MSEQIQEEEAMLIQYADLQRLVAEVLDAYEQSPVDVDVDVNAGETEAEYVVRKLWQAGYRRGQK